MLPPASSWILMLDFLLRLSGSLAPSNKSRISSLYSYDRQIHHDIINHMIYGFISLIMGVIVTSSVMKHYEDLCSDPVKRLFLKFISSTQTFSQQHVLFTHSSASVSGVSQRPLKKTNEGKGDRGQQKAQLFPPTAKHTHTHPSVYHQQR